MRAQPRPSRRRGRARGRGPWFKSPGPDGARHPPSLHANQRKVKNKQDFTSPGAAFSLVQRRRSLQQPTSRSQPLLPAPQHARPALPRAGSLIPLVGRPSLAAKTQLCGSSTAPTAAPCIGSTAKDTHGERSLGQFKLRSPRVFLAVRPGQRPRGRRAIRRQAAPSRWPETSPVGKASAADHQPAGGPGRGGQTSSK
jgi:hypothetical protein